MKHLVLLAVAITHGTAAYAVLNGKVVDFDDYPHTVLVRDGSDTGTGVLVGPRVVLTSRYSASRRATVLVDGRAYAVTKSETHAYPGGEQFGLGVLLLAEPVEGGRPISIAEEGPAVHEDVQLLGYGPWSPAMSAAPTLFLSVGTTRVSKWSKQHGFAMEGAAAANFGDAGGPVTNGKELLYGIMTQGNLMTLTYATNVVAHRSFLFGFAQANGVTICGVTELCATP